MFLPFGDQSSPPASVAMAVFVCEPRLRHPVKVRNPNLRSVLFIIRKKRKPLSIRRPARPVAVLIGDEDALGLGGRVARPHTFRCTVQRHDPDVRGLLVRRQIHIDRREQHPLAVGRRHRLANALQLHHVFESEGMLGLRKCRKGEEKNEEKSKTAHEVLRGTRECSKEQGLSSCRGAGRS